MLRSQIKKWFEEAVALDIEAPYDLKEAIQRGHPKLEGFFDNLTEQVLHAEKTCKQRGVTLRSETIQEFVYDLTKYFMKGLEGEATRRYESDMKRIAREAEQARQKEFDAVLAGKAVGEFAEAGVLTNEKIDAQREVGYNVQKDAPVLH